MRLATARQRWWHRNAGGPTAPRLLGLTIRCGETWQGKHSSFPGNAVADEPAAAGKRSARDSLFISFICCNWLVVRKSNVLQLGKTWRCGQRADGAFHDLKKWEKMSMMWDIHAGCRRNRISNGRLKLTRSSLLPETERHRNYEWQETVLFIAIYPVGNVLEIPQQLLKTVLKVTKHHFVFLWNLPFIANPVFFFFLGGGHN